MKQLANGITISRIIASLMLLAATPFTWPFYLIYVYCGLSDMVDGTIARKSGEDSKAGATLDSVADMIFVAVCAEKILPSVQFETWMWIWVAAIALIKVINLISGFIFHKRQIFLHTKANKVAGLFVFLWVLSIDLIPINCSAFIVCTVATFAAVQEGRLMRQMKYMGIITSLFFCSHIERKLQNI